MYIYCTFIVQVIIQWGRNTSISPIIRDIVQSHPHPVNHQRMVKINRVYLSPGEIEDTVAIPIPMVDRGRGVRNIIGVIIDRNGNDLYKVVKRWST